MGNTTTKIKQRKVSFQLRNFAIESLPDRPDQWNEQSTKTWYELTSCRIVTK